MSEGTTCRGKAGECLSRTDSVSVRVAPHLLFLHVSISAQLPSEIYYYVTHFDLFVTLCSFLYYFTARMLLWWRERTRHYE